MSDLVERLKKTADAVDLLDSGSRYTLSMRNATKAILTEAADALSLIEAERDKLRVPEGYVLVPREPTEAMIEAGVHAGVTAAPMPWCPITYRAMLAAIHPTDNDHGDGR